MTTDPTDRATWARILRCDLQSHAYTADHVDWPGVAIFTSAINSAFDLAVLQQTPPDQADALLDRIIDHYQARHSTPRVRVTPLSAPADWPTRLTQAGFIEADGEEVFMQLVGPLRQPPNPAVHVHQAPHTASLEDFVNTQSEGFGGSGPASDWVTRAHQALTRWDYMFLVAHLDGAPAGAASARFEDGVCGIYGVSTIDRFRRRGVSTTLLHTIVDEGHRRGCDLFFLSAEPHGYARRLYAKLGFVELFHTQHYEKALP